MSMIAYMRGTILERGEGALVVLANDIGYSIAASARLLDQCATSQDIELHIHHDTREGFNDLYGFATRDDKQLFELLLTVSRIGPKSALDVVSRAETDAIMTAIQSGSSEKLRAATKLGKKTAERITAELSEKVGKLDAPQGTASPGVVDALVGLGYRESEALEAIQHVDAGLPEDEQLKKALAHFQQAS